MNQSQRIKTNSREEKSIRGISSNLGRAAETHLGITGGVSSAGDYREYLRSVMIALAPRSIKQHYVKIHRTINYAAASPNRLVAHCGYSLRNYHRS